MAFPCLGCMTRLISWSRRWQSKSIGYIRLCSELRLKSTDSEERCISLRVRYQNVLLEKNRNSQILKLSDLTSYISFLKPESGLYEIGFRNLRKRNANFCTALIRNSDHIFSLSYKHILWHLWVQKSNNRSEYNRINPRKLFLQLSNSRRRPLRRNSRHLRNRWRTSWAQRRDARIGRIRRAVRRLFPVQRSPFAPQGFWYHIFQGELVFISKKNCSELRFSFLLLIFVFRWTLEEELVEIFRLNSLISTVYFQNPVNFMMTRPYIRKDVGLGLQGVSLGGTLCDYLAIRHPEFKAICSINGAYGITSYLEMKENGIVMPQMKLVQVINWSLRITRF